MPTHHRTESWNPDACPALAVRSSLFMGWPVCRCLHTKAPLWGRATRAGIPAHSSGPQPSRTIAGPLPFAGPASVNRAPLTARLLSLLKNSKNGTVHARLGPLRPLLRAGPGGCGSGAAFAAVWLAFQGKPRSGRGGSGESERVQREKRGTKENPSCLRTGLSPSGWTVPRGGHAGPRSGTLHQPRLHRH